MMLAFLSKLVPGKVYLYGAVAALIGGQYLYGVYMKNGRDTALGELAQVKSELSTVSYSYTAYKENMRMRVDTISTNLETMRKLHEKEQERVHELETLYSKHDLGMLITRKPTLTGKRFNAGTERLRNELEALTRDFARNTD